MKPQSCKNKGRRFQQKIASSIRSAFDHLTDDDVLSTSMGANGEDIRLSPLARRSVPLSIECKCVEKMNVWSCIEQARSNCPPSSTPCLVFSRNNEKTYAVLPWEAVLDLYKKVSEGGAIPSRVEEMVEDLWKEVQSRKDLSTKRESSNLLSHQ